MTSANFRTEGKVVKFIDMFNKKGGNKSTFFLKIFVDMSNIWDALLMSTSSYMSTTLQLFTAWSSVAVLKKKWFYKVLRLF